MSRESNFLNVGIQYEGIRQIGAALRETNLELHDVLKQNLMQIGNVVRDEARKEFVAELGKYKHSPRGQASIERTATGFHSRVRFSQGGSVVSVEQGIRKTTGARPDYGALQVTDGLLPARDHTLEQQARMLERDVVELLKKNGIA